MRPSEGFWGTGQRGHLFQGKKARNKCLEFRGTEEQWQFWGTGNIGNQYNGFGEQGNEAIYFRGTREQVLPWEGLMYVIIA